MNQAGQGLVMREQAKKINNNFYRDLLDYSDQELRKNPQNTFILIAKSYALTCKTTYYLLYSKKSNFNRLLSYAKWFQERILNIFMLCIEKVIIMLQNRRNFIIKYVIQILDFLKQHSQAIMCIDVALKFNPQYSIGYFKKGYSLRQKFNEKLQGKRVNILNQLFVMIKQSNQTQILYRPIIIKVQPYNTSELINMRIDRIKEYNDAIVCYDKAIQLDPNFVQAYNNKGITLQYIRVYQYEDTQSQQIQRCHYLL